MKFFSSDTVLAFISDASIDFTPADFDLPLSKDQQTYLKAQTGIDIPQVFWRKQVHGDDVIEIRGHTPNSKNELGVCPLISACPDADAFVTNQINLPIAIRTADCVPVFIFDPVKRVIGLAHAGWKGTHKQIAAKTVKTMQDKFDCRCYDLQVVLGPAIRRCCYQVTKEFREYFSKDVAERGGHLYVDIIAANQRQLVEAGVPAGHISDSGQCTCCNKAFFSFRRDGDTSGRMISLMMLCTNT